MPKAEANEKVRALQEMMGARADGMWGVQTSARFRAKLEDISARSGIELKGGKFDAKAFQQALDRNQIKPGDIAFVKAAIDMEQARQDNRGNTVRLSSLYNPNASVGQFAARPEGRPAPVPLARPEAPVPMAKPERTAGVKPSEPTANDRGTGVFYEALARLRRFRPPPRPSFRRCSSLPPRTRFSSPPGRMPARLPARSTTTRKWRSLSRIWGIPGLNTQPTALRKYPASHWGTP